MQSDNTANVNQELLNQTLAFLQWKLKHNSKNINEAKIANYLNVSMEEATIILQKLFDIRAVTIEAKSNCPICENDYLIEDINALIECNVCGNKFYPNQNKRLPRYNYTINEYYKDFRKPKERVRLSLVSKFYKGDNINMNADKVKVFLSYCHIDEEYKNKLNVHLSPLKKIDKIKEWDDRELTVGSQFDDIIKKHLEEDDIIILLVSADFINSDYCYNIEMKKAIERCINGQCKIIPVIIRPCLWQVTPLKKFLALPKDGKPLSTYDNEDTAYLEIVTALNEEIDNF